MLKLKSKPIRILLIFIGLSLMICLCSLLILSTDNPLMIRMRSSSPENAALSFSEALRKNNQFEAQQLSDPSIEGFLDDWMKNHQVTNCLNITTPPTSAGPVSSSPVTRVSTAFVCVSETDQIYCFSMKNIVVEEVGKNRWIVRSWESIEEGSSC